MSTEKSLTEGCSSIPWRIKQVKPTVQKPAMFSLEAFQDGVAIVHDLSVDRFLRVELRDTGRAVAMSANQLLLLLLEDVRTGLSVVFYYVCIYRSIFIFTVLKHQKLWYYSIQGFLLLR